MKLGEGSFGTVWRAVDRRRKRLKILFLLVARQTNGIVAVKQLDKANLPKRGVRRSDIERETSVMQAVNHEPLGHFGLISRPLDSQERHQALRYLGGRPKYLPRASWTNAAGVACR